MAMKITARFSFCAVLLPLVAAPLLAQSGPSASGGFHFSSGDYPLNIEFNARTHPNGSIDGRIQLTGTAAVPEQDVDGEGSSTGDTLAQVSIDVEVDCLKVNGNGAVMSGEISDSNIPAYVGRRALLAVVDNGEGKGDPDQFIWGLYATPDIDWVASDAELEVDPGVGLTWIATDFEREDDIGVPSHPSMTVDCATFPVVAYAFENLPKGAGNIQVKP